LDIVRRLGAKNIDFCLFDTILNGKDCERGIAINPFNFVKGF